MCNFLLHLSLYSIALNLIITSYMLSPTFPNFLSSSQQMEPTPSQVRNHYWQKKEEAHLERALAFKKAVNLHCTWSVSLRNICVRASDCLSRRSPIRLMKRDDETHPAIGNDRCEGTGESTLSSDIKEDNLNLQQEVLLQGLARWDKSWWPARDQMPNKWSRADTISARHLLQNS